MVQGYWDGKSCHQSLEHCVAVGPETPLNPSNFGAATLSVEFGMDLERKHPYINNRYLRRILQVLFTILFM